MRFWSRQKHGGETLMVPKASKLVEAKIKAIINDRCREQIRLLSEYRNAVMLHSARVALMAEMAGGLLAKAEFAGLSNITTQAYAKCVEAHEHFYKHMAA